VSGVVLLSETGNAAETTVTVSSATFTTTVTTGADGKFIITDVPAGDYTIRAESPGYLSVSGGITVAIGQMVIMPTVTLLAGGINGDVVIDELDVVQLAASYGQTVPPAPAGCDINRDGEVGLADLRALAKNLTLPRQTAPTDWSQE
jgi:hypothetical protein